MSTSMSSLRISTVIMTVVKIPPRLPESSGNGNVICNSYPKGKT